MKIKSALYKATKKIRYTSLAILFTNAGYSHSAIAQTPRTFDYDPGLLPEVAEVIFTLRVKYANIGKEFIINLSGSYLLKFTKDKIYILDTYTKKSDVYEYQTTNPNITIGLGISKGLPRNYKSITIKEDAHGKLYDYAALHSDNITTDETMLRETLSHPFYEIAGQEGVEGQVSIDKVMAFYRKVPSHVRHTRCVKSSTSIFTQLQEILAGSLECGPKAGLDIFTASHQPIKEMKLDEKLVEATVDEGEFRRTVGFQLLVRLNVKGNAVALAVASLHCKVHIMEMLANRRHKRAPTRDSGDCTNWVKQLVELFFSLGLNLRDLPQIIQSLEENRDIPDCFFPYGQKQPGMRGSIQLLVQIMYAHRYEVAGVLYNALMQVGRAVEDDPSYLHNAQDTQGAGSQVVMQEAVANASLGVYQLVRERFTPLLNQVRKLNSQLVPQVIPGGVYASDTHVNGLTARQITTYLEAINRWVNDIEILIGSTTNAEDKALLEQNLDIAMGIRFYLSSVNTRSSVDRGLVISVIK